MSARVIIVADPLRPTEWIDQVVESPGRYLKEHFGTWPELARIYDLEGINDVDRAAAATIALHQRDVTPRDEAGVKRLETLPGPLMVSVAPADPITAIIAVVAVALGVAAAVFLMPKIPEINSNFQSPNNQLTDRKNVPRPGARIPDIFGRVRSTPDMLSVPYRRYDGDIEVEVSFMCVGRGSYAISDVRDGASRLADVPGSSASFYGPYTSPNSGDPPQLQIGSAITDPVRSVVKMNEVNGQILRAPNVDSYKGDGSVRFVPPNVIEKTADGDDFSEYFEPGDEVVISNASFGGQGYYDAVNASAKFAMDGTITFTGFDPTTLFYVDELLTITGAVFAYDPGTGVVTVDLSGTYTILAVTSTTITVDIS